MLMDEFIGFVKELGTYFERSKPPVQDAINLWFARVRLIKSEAIRDIKYHIQENHDTFPRNLPSVMWDSYRDWQRGNAENEKSAKQSMDCPECNDGYIFTRRSGYRYVYRCGICRQAPENGIPHYEEKEVPF